MAEGWPDWPAVKATDGNEADGLAPVAVGDPATPPPPTKAGKRLRIETAASARRQMVKIYREMREGTLDITKGSKLIYALTEISRALERESIDRLNERLEAVEQAKR